MWGAFSIIACLNRELFYEESILCHLKYNEKIVIFKHKSLLWKYDT
jgi:hypothetical protein